jgi:hypothetical protein
MQYLYKDEHGITRFRPNRIIQWLNDTGKLSLNEIATLAFDVEDREQLAQLLGYSLSGFAELSYVREETYEKVQDLLKRGILHSLRGEGPKA